jgi:hypothetical protein
VYLALTSTHTHTYTQAFTEPPFLSGGAVGKEGLAEYISRGYFANNNGDQVGISFLSSSLFS